LKAPPDPRGTRPSEKKKMNARAFLTGAGDDDEDHVHGVAASHVDDEASEYDGDEDEEEITLTQYLVETLWKDKRTRYQLWNCGKVVVLFGVTVWAMRRFPHFQDPERLDHKVMEYMDYQQRLAMGGM
jgi:hypothetical protein